MADYFKSHSNGHRVSDLRPVVDDDEQLDDCFRIGLRVLRRDN